MPAKHICPVCGSPALVKFRSWVGIRQRGRESDKVLVCDNYPECDTWVAVHHGTMQPMGRMAGKRTRFLRYKAHELLRLYTEASGRSKDEAYRELESDMCLPNTTLHFSEINDSQLENSIRHLESKIGACAGQDGAQGSNLQE